MVLSTAVCLHTFFFFWGGGGFCPCSTSDGHHKPQRPPAARRQVSSTLSVQIRPRCSQVVSRSLTTQLAFIQYKGRYMHARLSSLSTGTTADLSVVMPTYDRSLSLFLFLLPFFSHFQFEVGTCQKEMEEEGGEERFLYKYQTAYMYVTQSFPGRGHHQPCDVLYKYKPTFLPQPLRRRLLPPPRFIWVKPPSLRRWDIGGPCVCLECSANNVFSIISV